MRELPSVEELASRLADLPRRLAVEAARGAIDARREELVSNGGAGSDRTSDGSDAATLETAARARASAAARPSLRPVLNATGVILHTNLGRAPLAVGALEAAVSVAAGYSTLEYDLGRGARGSRQDHVEGLVCELTGAEAALVVNNCAAAVLLAATALGTGGEIAVSRGQLVEIGGSFRVPEVVEASGARLVEVGTTNRTRLADYERALGSETAAILRVHPSNFRTVGFVEEASIEELCELGRRAGLPVIDDAGSGALVERIAELADEPPVRRSVAAGCAVVCFSGDKLLGGPQAGLMAGTAAALARCRAHPLARALRIDKLSLAALEATLRLLRDPEAATREIPVMRMLLAGETELDARAQQMRAALTRAGVAAEVERGSARMGGGTLPLLELEGPVCALSSEDVDIEELAVRLRAGEPPVIARVAEGRLLLDPRTLDDEAAELAAGAVVATLRRV
ncbi:MAG: L-seryl-tRNA(Sec) selenium transferase [Thermoleophilaceae bacterium]|nr:L-seryl-tRNA(Sec) selenium transferase [Thermoleophilaceae bacterium]